MIEFFEEKYLTVYQVGLEEEAVFYHQRTPHSISIYPWFLFFKLLYYRSVCTI